MLVKLSATIQTKLSPTFRKIITNVGWLFMDRVLRIIVEPLVWVWIARYLGPEQLGTYNYALSFVALFEVLTGLGLRGIIVRDIVREPDQKNEILGTTFALKLIGGICCLATSITVITLTQPNNYLIHWLVGIFALTKIFQISGTIGLWFESQVKSKLAIYSTSIAFILVTVGKIVLICTNASLIAFAWLVVIQVFIETVGFVIAYQKTGESIKIWKSSLSKAMQLLKQSWPLILAGIGTSLYLKIDQVMLGNMSGTKEVGIYSAAVRFSEASYFIPTIITGTVFPLLVKSRATGKELYQNHLQKLYNWMTWTAIGIAIIGGSIANTLINFLYGKEYQAAGTILAIHIWSTIFIFWHQINMDWLVNEGLLKFPLIRQGLGAISNVLLNLLLIPKYGGIGASIATVVSYAIASYFAFFLTSKTRVAANMMTLSLIDPFIIAGKKIKARF